jgi:hypothetical protein
MSKSLNKRGRPAGMRAFQLDLQQKLFEHPDNNKVIEAVYRAALDDDHKHQAAAQKLLMDRMLPISVCDKNADIREKITININSVEIPEREEKVVN